MDSGSDTPDGGLPATTVAGAARARALAQARRRNRRPDRARELRLLRAPRSHRFDGRIVAGGAADRRRARDGDRRSARRRLRRRRHRARHPRRHHRSRGASRRLHAPRRDRRRPGRRRPLAADGRQAVRHRARSAARTGRDARDSASGLLCPARRGGSARAGARPGIRARRRVRETPLLRLRPQYLRARRVRHSRVHALSRCLPHRCHPLDRRARGGRSSSLPGRAGCARARVRPER